MPQTSRTIQGVSVDYMLVELVRVKSELEGWFATTKEMDQSETSPPVLPGNTLHYAVDVLQRHYPPGRFSGRPQLPWDGKGMWRNFLIATRGSPIWSAREYQRKFLEWIEQQIKDREAGILKSVLDR